MRNISILWCIFIIAQVGSLYTTCIHGSACGADWCSLHMNNGPQLFPFQKHQPGTTVVGTAANTILPYRQKLSASNSVSTTGGGGAGADQCAGLSFFSTEIVMPAKGASEVCLPFSRFCHNLLSPACKRLVGDRARVRAHTPFHTTTHFFLSFNIYKSWSAHNIDVYAIPP